MASRFFSVLSSVKNIEGVLALKRAAWRIRSMSACDQDTLKKSAMQEQVEFR